MNINFAAVPRFVLGINWQTTAAAIAPLLTSLSVIATDISKGEWPSHQDEMVVISFLSIGWGLIRAKDRNVTGGQISNVDGSKAAFPVSMANMVPTAAPGLPGQVAPVTLRNPAGEQKP